MDRGAPAVTPCFSPGSAVRVCRRYPPGHTRAPFFMRGKAGVVEEIAGAYHNPEELAYGIYDGALLPLYRVLFRQLDVWPDYSGSSADTLIVDIYENWLERTDAS